MQALEINDTFEGTSPVEATWESYDKKRSDELLQRRLAVLGISAQKLHEEFDI